MSTTTEAAVGILFICVVILIFARSTRGQRTVSSFYWGSRALKPWQSAMLMLATALSLNGLLYQSWLGYAVGIWSAIIQLIFCAGYLFLALYAKRFLSLSENTLHGQFRDFYGPSAGVIAAIASFIGFASLAGWEFSIFGSLLADAIHLNSSTIVYGMYVVAFLPALYTIRGGLRGNANVNTAFNVISYVVVIGAIFCLFYMFAKSGDITLTAAGIAPRLKLDFHNLIIGLGGIAALASNVLFSFLWQGADMSVWQDVAGSGTSVRNVRRSLIQSSVLVFLAPGLFGALLGIALQHLKTITQDNVLSAVFNIFSVHPVLAIALFAGFLATMLSTLDGLFLAASLSLVGDVFFRGKFATALRAHSLGEAPATEPRGLEVGILTASYLTILLVALIAGTFFYVVHTYNIPLFEAVYFAVIGQMSLVPGVYAIILDKSGRLTRRMDGFMSVLFALVGGWGTVLLSLNNVAPFSAAFLDWVPLITIGSGIVGAAIPIGRRPRRAAA
ncbi:MAG: hypothetical protein JO261_12510 [Alphaproteobacteria bacterium]|nr:hypothetical protein [Alphaproteobacteria bacterium]MBV9694512.1 hypothetical protein [Alphaproteobacteria bacterium]